MSKPKVLLLLISDDENDLCIDLYTYSAANYLETYLRDRHYIVSTVRRDIKELKNPIHQPFEWFKPDIIGVNTMFPFLTELFTELKANNPNFLICYGAGKPTSQGENILKNYSILDYIVYGESELTWKNLLECIETGGQLDNVKGLMFRKDGEIKTNEPAELIDINLLPFVGITYAPFERLDTSEGEAVVETSRGCTNNCSFCCMRHNQLKYRAKDVETAVDEIEHISKNYYIYRFRFSDFSFEDPNINRLTSLLKEIITRDLNISFGANFRPSFIRKVTPEISDLLMKAGLYSAFVGVETANESDLKLYHKGSTLDEAQQIINYFRSIGVHVEIGFIMFNPYSTVDRLRKNVSYLKRYGLANFNIIKTILKDPEGTPIHEKIMQDNIPFVRNKKFLENNIGELYHFVELYIKKHLSETVDSYQSTLQFLNTISNDIVHAKRLETEETQAALKEHYQNMMQIVNNMSAYICEWFNKLLDLTETGFDYKKAAEISVKYLDSDFINEAQQMITDEFNKAHEVLFPEIILPA